ncbi:MAG: hypothetical protein AAGJ95_10200 [Cyanobacteria bacterium J06554_11]
MTLRKLEVSYGGTEIIKLEISEGKYSSEELFQKVKQAVNDLGLPDSAFVQCEWFGDEPITRDLLPDPPAEYWHRIDASIDGKKLMVACNGHILLLEGCPARPKEIEKPWFNSDEIAKHADKTAELLDSADPAGKPHAGWFQECLAGDFQGIEGLRVTGRQGVMGPAFFWAYDKLIAIIMPCEKRCDGPPVFRFNEAAA